MSTTSAPTIRAALIAALQDRLAMKDVAVTHVWQGQADEQQRVYLGNTSADLAFATIRAGRKKREEDYTIQLIIDVEDPTDWGPASEARAFELAGDVDDLLAADPALGLSATLPTLRIHVSHLEQASGALENAGLGTRITLTLSVQSRLT